MIVGGASGAKRTLPSRSPCTICDGASTTANADARRSRVSSAGSSASCQAIRSAHDQGSSAMSRKSGLVSPARARWKPSPARSTSLTRDSSAAPGSHCQASQRSTLQFPVRPRIGRGARNASVCSSAARTSAFHWTSPSASEGRSTIAPARHARPRPPGRCSSGASDAPKAVRTASDGRRGSVMDRA